MNTTELLALFRADIDDLAVPPLWSDEEILGYMDDAQKMFTRLTWGIRDSTSPMCSLDMTAGEPFAETDPRILKIVRIQRGSDARPIRMVNVEDMDTEGVRLDGSVGEVGTAVFGLGEDTLRWVRVPAKNDTASLIVERMPLSTLSTGRSTRLEIGAQHQRHLMLWMASLAYAKQDADTRDERKAARKDTEFRAYCAAAKAEKAKAQSQTRSVRYGGL